MTAVSANKANSAATHLGRTMHRDRTAHGWTLRAFAARTGIIYSTLSAVENGRRPFSEKLAIACDEQFPEKRGWYLQYYEESRSWTPPGFRNWAEHEDKATVIRSWTPGVVDGLLQTEGYARALLETLHAGAEVTAARLAGRMARQQRVVFRPEPPTASFVVDELSLYRFTGSPQTMASQMRHLAEVARLPHVTLQILPGKANPATQSILMVTENAAYAEHLLAGGVYTEPEAVTGALRLFNTISSESYTASESLRRLEVLEMTWTGVKAAAAEPTAARA